MAGLELVGEGARLSVLASLVLLLGLSGMGIRFEFFHAQTCCFATSVCEFASAAASSFTPPILPAPSLTQPKV